MGADTLLTLLGLIIAAYAVLPVERQLDLKLRLKAFDLFVAGSAVFLILYIQFYPILSSLRVVPQLGSWKWGFDQKCILIDCPGCIHYRLLPCEECKGPSLNDIDLQKSD